MKNKDLGEALLGSIKRRLTVKTWWIGSLAAVIGVSLGLGWCAHALYAAKQETPEMLSSGLMRQTDAREATGEWGKMHIYFTGESHASTDIFSGLATIRPGEALHPTHRHAGEEFLVLTEGSGEWFLEGDTYPAEEGDVLYVEPWKRHGLRNTSEEPLTFFVAKWKSKGIESPKPPED